jgi:hypothetical protein
MTQIEPGACGHFSVELTHWHRVTPRAEQAFACVVSYETLKNHLKPAAQIPQIHIEMLLGALPPRT